jgi:hypothetical protein
VLLFAASAAVVVWGVLYAWEAGVWIIMLIVLIAPMMFAAILFTLAARSEESFAPVAEKPQPASAGTIETPGVNQAPTR